MKKILMLAVTLAVSATASAQSLNFKDKMKAGEYEYTMSTEMGAMPGMPEGMKGMKMPGMTFKHCVTQKDIDEGDKKVLGQGRGERGPKDCEMKDMKQTATGMSYKMVCKGEMQMEIDAVMTFTPTGFKSTSKMTGNRGGQPMNMTQNMEVKYLGACKS